MFQHTCLDCETRFSSKSSFSRYCSDHCKWRVKARRRYPRAQERKREIVKQKWTLECVYCGCKIDSPSGARKYCAQECRNQYPTHKRRAVAYGVAYERFDKYEIFERDNWICGICDDPVGPLLEHPDPMSASLDHVIPLSKGGGHVPSNVQCSHLACNLQKGVDHVIEERELERST